MPQINLLRTLLRTTLAITTSLSVVAARDANLLPTVCVTGATGYLASELIAQLLSTGRYMVRGTVRSLANEEKLAPLRTLSGAAERLELMEADLFDAGSFEPCIAGVMFVFHTASPFITSNIVDPMTQLVEPAVKGTEAVLAAAALAGVTRVVLTSSIAAVKGAAPKADGSCFSEDDWNESSTLDGDGLDQYRYSKTLAEKAAWAFVGSERAVHAASGHRLELATILPSFIIGPPRTPRVDSESLANMAALLEGRLPPRGDTPMVDVRDAAAAHVAAAELPGAAGSRFIVSTPRPVTRAQVMEVVADAQPDLDLLRSESPDAARAPQPVIFCSRTADRLDVRWTAPEDSLRDMASAMVRQGVVEAKHRAGAALDPAPKHVATEL